MNKEEQEHQLKLNAICQSDKWYSGLTKQEQFFVKELASRAMSQGIVMLMEETVGAGLICFLTPGG